MNDLPDAGTFGAAFEDFVRAMTAAARRPEPELLRKLQEHLGVDLRTLPATSGEFPVTERPNLQLALDALAGDAEVIGFNLRHLGMEAPSLSDLVESAGGYGMARLGPVHHIDVEIGDGRVVKCTVSAVFLARHEGAPVAFVLVPASDHHPMQPSRVKIEGVSPDPDAMSRLLRDLRAKMRELNVFRGKVISLHADHFGGVTVKFHTIPPVPRTGVILPDGTLDRLDRQTLGVAASADRLRAAGRHLKRGVLLHGPPGTGKTLTVTYLLGAMPGRTTVLLTGPGLGLVDHAVSIARDLAPATVVLEDVDLVAAERTMPMAHGDILFDLLNQMEGIAEDEDLLFVLTTNRPDLVEPALVARPGRIDLALEVPLPDDDGRRRLLRLYAGDLEIEPADEDELVARSAGVSGAFVKELVRQAWLRSSLEARPKPTGSDLRDVLDELLDERNALTRRLLGQQGDAGSPDSGPLPAMLHAAKVAGLPVPEAPDYD